MIIIIIFMLSNWRSGDGAAGESRGNSARVHEGAPVFLIINTETI